MLEQNCGVFKNSVVSETTTNIPFVTIWILLPTSPSSILAESDPVPLLDINNLVINHAEMKIIDKIIICIILKTHAQIHTQAYTT